ncbi:hypothetical protein AGM53_23710 [Salmonella enterica subsp. enterica]|nr:hypothetical protein [Salmonella enterica subsp. enterica serovar Typhimurium]
MSRSSSFFGASAGGAGATLPVVSIPCPAGRGILTTGSGERASQGRPPGASCNREESLCPV